MSFTVYRSSAGSGKTYTLVKEYLKIALGKPEHDAYKTILAITFTNKAANEMKERIVETLGSFSSDDKLTGTPQFMMTDLKSELKLTEPKIRKKAASVLRHLLHHYSDFSVLTIDKFVHRIVRTFAHDLDIPLNFEVELDANTLLQKAIDILIAGIGENAELTQALVDFTESKANDERSWHIEGDLFQFATGLLREDGHLFMEKIKYIDLKEFFRIRDALQEQIDEFESTIADIGKSALELIDTTQIPFAAFAQGTRGLPSYFGKLARMDHKGLEPGVTIQKVMNGGKKHSGKATELDIVNIESIWPQLQQCYNDALDYLDKNAATFHIHRLINKNIYALAVLNELEKIVLEYKKENNVLHISEFNRMIAEIVYNEPAAFIYERLGDKYLHYLIDEFQDTSVLQWQNLLPLIDNSLASGHFNLVVGDGKQSIYRWRGGEVEQFASLPKISGVKQTPEIQFRQEALNRNYEEKKLQQNFRSKAEVVRFNNYFFRELANDLHDDWKSIYEGLEQQYNPKNTGGYVSIEAIESGAEKTYQEAVLDRTLAIIKEAGQDGYPYEDITVLCRRNSEASMIANFLLQNQVPVVSSESLILSNSPKVRFVIAFMRYLCDSKNKSLQSSLLIHARQMGLLEEEIHRYLKFINARESKFSVDKFFHTQGYSFFVERLIQLPVYEIVEEVIRIFHHERQADPYLAFLLEFAYTFSSKKNNNLAEFLEFWQERMNKLSIVVPEGTTAIRIMTVHKSKGLEFPVVIYPFAKWDGKPGQDNLWIDMEEGSLNLQSALIPTEKSLANTAYGAYYEEEDNKTKLDNLNVTYVAFTRPSDRLFVLMEKSKDGFRQREFNLLTDSDEWEADESAYRSGLLVKRAEIEAKPLEHTSRSLKKMISQDWREKLAVSLQAGDVWDTDSADNPFHLGSLVRTAFRGMKTAADLHDAIEDMVLDGMVQEDEADMLAQKLNTLVHLPQLVPFFEKGNAIKIKEELLLANGSAYAPERIVLSESSANILELRATQKGKRKENRELQACVEALKSMGLSNVQIQTLYMEEEVVKTS